MTDERITPEEMRSFMSQVNSRLRTIEDQLEAMQAGLQQASAPGIAGSTSVFVADELVLDYMDGKAVYKLRGNEYSKFGVRVWPEVLPQLGIDVDQLKPGSTRIEPVKVQVRLKEIKDDETGQVHQAPQKVIGKA